jgi:hypothetical protein
MNNEKVNNASTLTLSANNKGNDSEFCRDQAISRPAGVKDWNDDEVTKIQVRV